MWRASCQLVAEARAAIGYRHAIVLTTTSFVRSTAMPSPSSRCLRRLRRVSMVLVVALLGAACSDEKGEPVLDVGTDAVGTCLNFEEAPEFTVEYLPVVDCNEPHTQEIYFVATVTDEPVYPGFEALESIAQVRCLGEFENYVGISPFESEYFFSWLVPTLNTWENDGDREIICVIGEGNAAGLPPGSVRDTAR